MGMVLDAVPVIPPDLRPMVQLDGGRFATSDLNDLYRRVINRNNRLKRLLDLGAPEIIINNEKRMLQEAVDALFDNGRRGRPVTGPGNRALKSLSDMLKGKQGRFRQNLLGKRVDYSGRSVIVVGPQLKLHQCGLPKQMALELFKPFVMKRLVDLEYAQNIKSAKRMVERARPQVWDVLEEVIKEHPVFLNRAPTLHRLGIQAFEPVLVEGKAIQIHPLVCTAFNADFDGDQMAVHLPLSAEAQAEARHPHAVGAQHPVAGARSPDRRAHPGHDHRRLLPDRDRRRARPATAGRSRRSTRRCSRTTSVSRRPRRRTTELSLHAKIKVRMPARPLPRGPVPGARRGAPRRHRAATQRQQRRLRACSSRRPSGGSSSTRRSRPTSRSTTDAVQEARPHRDRQRAGRALPEGRCGREPRQAEGPRLRVRDPFRSHHLDRRRADAGQPRPALLEKFEEEAEKVESQFDRGIITDDERRQKEIEIWTDGHRPGDARRCRPSCRPSKFNPIDMMVGSGARGNVMQVRQIAGMRGLVANPRGEIIPRPIKSNFREGLSVLEYFISTHGARKGLADTALRTADSGYLTRRLVDVAQELIVREDDCESTRGIWVENVDDDPETLRILETKLLGRCLAEDVTLADGTSLPRNTEIGEVEVPSRWRPTPACHAGAGPVGAHLRVAQRCVRGVLRHDAGHGKLVDLGEAIGIIAAQSIGEPGTQLTMRTFHTGGVAGEDITHGLPRVVELFEARTPKGAAVLAETLGCRPHRREREGRARAHRRRRRRHRGGARGHAPHAPRPGHRRRRRGRGRSAAHR